MSTGNHQFWKLLVVPVLFGIISGQIIAAPSLNERAKVEISFSEEDLTGVANSLINLIPVLGSIADLSVDLQDAGDLMCFNFTVTIFHPYACFAVEYKDWRLYVKYHSGGVYGSQKGIVDDILEPLRKGFKKLVRKAVKSLLGDWKLRKLAITDTELILTVSNKPVALGG